MVASHSAARIEREARADQLVSIVLEAQEERAEMKSW